MKKSFDYFKTLNEMSDCVLHFLSALFSGSDFKQFSVSFYGKRYELAEHLFNDFVAPVERNDIYNLSNCLYMQFCELSSLATMCDSLSISFFGLKDDFSILLNLQTKVMAELSEKTAYSSLIKTTREGQLQSNTIRCKLNKYATECLCGSSQRLYNFVLISRFIGFCQIINDSFCQCERVIINNI